MLIVDNHKSRFDVDVLQTLRENGIEMVLLPPYSTLFMQPLDVVNFGILVKECDGMVADLIGDDDSITRHNIARLYKPAFLNALSLGHNLKAFKNTGLWPIDRNAIKNVDQYLAIECDSPAQIRRRERAREAETEAARAITTTSTNMNASLSDNDGKEGVASTIACTATLTATLGLNRTQERGHARRPIAPPMPTQVYALIRELPETAAILTPPFRDPTSNSRRHARSAEVGWANLNGIHEDEQSRLSKGKKRSATIAGVATVGNDDPVVVAADGSGSQPPKRPRGRPRGSKNKQKAVPKQSKKARAAAAAAVVVDGEVDAVPFVLPIPIPALPAPYPCVHVPPQLLIDAHLAANAIGAIATIKGTVGGGRRSITRIRGGSRVRSLSRATRSKLISSPLTPATAIDNEELLPLEEVTVPTTIVVNSQQQTVIAHCVNHARSLLLPSHHSNEIAGDSKRSSNNNNSSDNNSSSSSSSSSSNTNSSSSDDEESENDEKDSTSNDDDDDDDDIYASTQTRPSTIYRSTRSRTSI
jgi:hypothetical protein